MTQKLPVYDVNQLVQYEAQVEEVSVIWTTDEIKVQKHSEKKPLQLKFAWAITRWHVG